MSINHDNEYHGDINYGHLFPEDWYWYELTEEESQPEDSTNHQAMVNCMADGC